MGNTRLNILFEQSCLDLIEGYFAFYRVVERFFQSDFNMMRFQRLIPCIIEIMSGQYFPRHLLHNEEIIRGKKEEGRRKNEEGGKKQRRTHLFVIFLPKNHLSASIIFNTIRSVLATLGSKYHQHGSILLVHLNIHPHEMLL